MRLTVCLESDTEGRVLASVDMEEILKQCKENSISKEAFEQMKSKSHRHGYRQGYSKAIDDFAKFANTMPTVETEDGTIRPMWLEEMAERLKEQNNEQ